MDPGQDGRCERISVATDEQELKPETLPEGSTEGEHSAETTVDKSAEVVGEVETKFEAEKPVEMDPQEKFLRDMLEKDLKDGLVEDTHQAAIDNHENVEDEPKADEPAVELVPINEEQVVRVREILKSDNVPERAIDMVIKDLDAATVTEWIDAAASRQHDIDTRFGSESEKPKDGETADAANPEAAGPPDFDSEINAIVAPFAAEYGEEAGTALREISTLLNNRTKTQVEALQEAFIDQKFESAMDQLAGSDFPQLSNGEARTKLYDRCKGLIMSGSYQGKSVREVVDDAAALEFKGDIRKTQQEKTLKASRAKALSQPTAPQRLKADVPLNAEQQADAWLRNRLTGTSA